MGTFKLPTLGMARFHACLGLLSCNCGGRTEFTSILRYDSSVLASRLYLLYDVSSPLCVKQETPRFLIHIHRASSYFLSHGRMKYGLYNIVDKFSKMYERITGTTQQHVKKLVRL